MDTADLDETGRPRYTAFWAFGRPGEKRAFEALIDFITERRARCPGLHVYHYNHYEPTSVDHLTELHGTRQEAVGALMGRFATREDEVDQLFRLGVFVDLYRVVRQGWRCGTGWRTGGEVWPNGPANCCRARSSRRQRGRPRIGAAPLLVPAAGTQVLGWGYGG